MANMALNIEQRLGQKLTNEQLIIWNYLLQRWPNLTFIPLFYAGNIGGSVFETYNANILYYAYEFGIAGVGSSASIANVQLFNEINAHFFTMADDTSYWDVTAAAARYSGNTLSINNLYFSRIIRAGYTQIRFNGYVLTI